MDSLIIVKDGTALLDPATAPKIEDFERTIKELKEAEDELKKAILAEMEEKNILSLKTETMSISYIGESDRETLDTKKLNRDYPDIYDECVKMSHVNASVRIKLK